METFTKDNLTCRGAASLDLHCASWCLLFETFQYLFVKCPFFSNVWNLVLNWMSINCIMLTSVLEHAFGGLYLNWSMYYKCCMRFEWLGINYRIGAYIIKCCMWFGWLVINYRIGACIIKCRMWFEWLVLNYMESFVMPIFFNKKNLSWVMFRIY